MCLALLKHYSFLLPLELSFFIWMFVFILLKSVAEHDEFALVKYVGVVIYDDRLWDVGESLFSMKNHNLPVKMAGGVFYNRYIMTGGGSRYLAVRTVRPLFRGVQIYHITGVKLTPPSALSPPPHPLPLKVPWRLCSNVAWQTVQAIVLNLRIHFFCRFACILLYLVTVVT